MTTLAQSYYISAHPDKSHDFTDNEGFEQFREHLLFIMPATKLDAEVVDISSKPKDKKITKGVVYRRSHNAVRSSILRKKLSLLNIQRFLLSEVQFYSQQIEEEIDDELITEWKLQISPYLKELGAKTSFETLLGVLTKVLTLPENGKTMVSYLGAGKKKEDIEEIDDSDDSSFTIPK